MKVDDWLIYYSPKTDMTEGKPLQMFTAIGKVTGETVYPFEMSPDFIPFRLDITYLKCKPAPIQPLLSQLSFIKDLKHWGYSFRTGHIEIPKHDFEIISHAMGVLTHN